MATQINMCGNEIISSLALRALRITLKFKVNLMKVRTAQEQNVESREDVPRETPSYVIQAEY